MTAAVHPAGSVRPARDPAVDTGRGILVLLMIYGHTLQFFGDAGVFPAVDTLVNLINLLVFPSFVFYFGRTAALAYLSRPWRQALPGLLRTCGRSLGAFWLSGVAFRVLRENKAFSAATVRRVLLLEDLPGWSEFLAAFAVYALLTLALFVLFRYAGQHPAAALAAGAACLACTFLPYDRLGPTWVSLLVGGTDYCYFPAVQYMPYFLAGVVCSFGSLRRRWLLPAMAAAASAVCGVWTLAHGLPGRFPPTLAWVLLPAGGVAALAYLCRGLHRLRGPTQTYCARPAAAFLGAIGTRSLYYLLGSNLVLFTLSGKGVAPSVSRRSVIPWTLPIQSPAGALCWALALTLALMFVAALAGRRGPKAA